MMAKQSQFMKYTERGEWRAPQSIYDALHKQFDFRDRATYGPLDGGAFYMEPPAFKQLEYVEAAYKESQSTGAIVVVFLRSDTGSGWFQTWAYKASEIIFIESRVKMVDSAGNEGPNPIGASLILVFYPGPSNQNWPQIRGMRRVDGAYYLAKKHNQYPKTLAEYARVVREDGGS